MTATVLRRSRPLFTLTAATLATLCVVMARSQLFARNPDLAAWGVTFDLTLSIPLLYYFFVIRPGYAKPLTIAPLFVAGVALAALIVPRDHQQFLHQLRFVSAPLDLLTIALIGRRIVRMRRGPKTDDDPHARIQAAARGILGDTRMAALVAMEVSVMYYALFAWRKPSPRHAAAITVHEESGWGSIVACILVLLAAESIGLHLLLQIWFKQIVVWSVTALDVYGVLWLIGDYHALRLRPTRVEEGVLHVRHGLRWSVDVPLVNVASIARVEREEEWKRKGVLKLALFDEPRYLVHLRQPLVAHGIAGISKTIDAIAIRPDDDAAFNRLLRSPEC